MADFKGKKCMVCEREFADGDDIVVCPECGTPYHRECYLEKGECINYELHESGGSWSEQQEEAAAAMGDEDIKCPRCGNDNPGNAIFCNYCGLPLGVSGGAQQSFNNADPRYTQQGGYGDPRGGMQGQGGFSPMFGVTQRFTPESDIDGNTLGEYANYVRTNRSYFMAQFIRFGRFAKKASFSLMAFLFPEYYFFYRKMFKVGILIFIAMTILSLPGMIYSFNAGSEYLEVYESLVGVTMPETLINNVNINANWFNAVYNLFYFGKLALQVACGIYANFWYYKKAKRDIAKIKSVGGQNEAIAAKGGTSFGLLLVSFAMYMAVSVVLLMALHYRADIIAML